MFSQKQTASNNNNDYGYIQKRAESPFQTTLHATTLQSLSSTPMRSYSKGVPSPFRYQDFKDRNRCVDSEYERNKEFRDYKYHGGDFTYPRTSPYKPKFYWFKINIFSHHISIWIEVESPISLFGLALRPASKGGKRQRGQGIRRSWRWSRRYSQCSRYWIKSLPLLLWLLFHGWEFVHY